MATGATGRFGRSLRSAGVFILLIVLGDSAMTSVRSEEAARPAVTHLAVADHVAQFHALALQKPIVQTVGW